jgi:MFS family permease
MRRLRDGEWIAGGAGLALLASLFLDWYGGRSAWRSLAVIDIVVALLALVPLALVVLQATRRSPALPVAFSVLTPLAGAFAALLIGYRIADQPGPDRLLEVHGGAWLGLAAAVVVVVGGWRSLRVERIPGAPAVPVDELPAPPRGADA